MAVLGNRATGLLDMAIEAFKDKQMPNEQLAPTVPGQGTVLRPEPTVQMPAPQQVATVQTNPALNQAPAMQPGQGVMRSPNMMPSMPAGQGVMQPGMDREQMIEKARVASELVKRGAAETSDPTVMDKIKGYFGNRENMIKLALAFNSMRLNPDTGLAAALATEQKDLRAQKLLTTRANATIEALRKAGVPEKDLQVLAKDPELLKKYAIEFFKKQMGVDPAEIQAFKKLTEGMSQEDIDKAKRIELGLEPRAGSQFALGLEELFARSAAQAGGSQAGKSEQEKKELQVQNDKTWNIWKTAISGLEESLGNTATGRVVGLLPAITSSQQIADQAIAIMAPVLKNIFRESGEGVFTDKDQQILIDMIPDRGSNPDTIAYAIKMINDLVAAKLNQPTTTMQIPTPSAGSQVLRFDAQGNPIR